MKITESEQTVMTILSVRKGRIPPSTPTCSKRHSDCFVYILSGEAEYCFQGKRQIARAGNVLYLARNSQYSIRVTDNQYTFLFVDFNFSPSDVVFENEVYQSKSVSVLENSFSKLYTLWSYGNISDKIYCKSILYQIYSELVKSSFSQYVSRSRREQMEQIAQYITRNLSDSNLNVEQLSHLCQISDVHFRRIFSCIYHVSPVKFLRNARINRAKELLLLEQYTVAEVAEQCGFQNHYYFSKVFKEETNLTPSQFRTYCKTNI